MNIRTVTILGNLQVGDRFYFSKASGDKKVYEVIDQLGKQSEVNIPAPTGGYCFKYPELKNKETSVVFLRHTVEQNNSINQTDELSEVIK